LSLRPVRLASGPASFSEAALAHPRWLLQPPNPGRDPGRDPRACVLGVGTPANAESTSDDVTLGR